MEENRQQERHNRKDSGVADDSDVAQLHIANDHTAQPAKGQCATSNQQHANRHAETIPPEDRRGEQDGQREESVLKRIVALISCAGV
jgi:hypothetical protein